MQAKRSALRAKARASDLRQPEKRWASPKRSSPLATWADPAARKEAASKGTGLLVSTLL